MYSLSGLTVTVLNVEIEPARSRKYKPEEVERALLELAVLGGNSGEASRRLRDVGIEINARLLRLWRTETHERRYREICAENAREIEEAVIQECRESAMLAARVERAALQATLDQIESGDLRDPASAARNAATVKGINLDKMLVLSGRPNEITGKLSPDDMLAQLVRDGVFKPVTEGQSADFELPDDLVIELDAPGISPGD